VLPAIERYLALVDGLLRSAAGSARPGLLGIGARYAEFASWMNQDRGDLASASFWADVALEWCIEASDTVMVSYVLMRKSSQAEILRDAGRTIGLARAAQQPADLPVRVRAVAAQQEAHGHALAGDELACHRKLDEAGELSGLDQPSDLPGRYCIPTYVEMQRASCCIELGRPDMAVPLFERELDHLPPVHRRDRGVYLARLARAHAATGDPDAAVARARQALDLAVTTGSARITTELRQLEHRLSEWRELPAVVEFNSGLGNLA
jgi:tetratricopeptide (TPR) repeat protein